MATLEHKSTQFVTQFAATVFAQWKQTQEKERFWLNAAFLRDLLEEAVAKLPKIPLKSHLVRELQPAVAELKTLLEAHYADHQKHEGAQKKSPKGKHALKQELLNEEDVERALATADDAKRRELAAVLALDEYATAATKSQGKQVASVVQIETYVAQLQRISARSYESPDELARKRGFYVQRIAQCAEQVVGKWAADKSGNWDCSPAAPHSAELQKLRAALQQIVSHDAVVDSDFDSSSSVLPAPWTSFYRPSESAVFLKIDYEEEIAKVFGVLLTLAIYFPIVQDEDDDEATSDESSDSDSDSQPQSSQAALGVKKQAKLDFLEQAKQTVRHVNFASKKRTDASWLFAVLAFVHQLPKPKSYKEDDDDDELALVASDQRALQDCLSDVYSRAFANPDVWENCSLGPDSKANDLQLFQTIVCLRHAVQFMRSERHQSIPSVTTATAKLVSVPLPQSFWQLLAHAKKMHASQSPLMREATKKLSKNKSAKTASSLLSASAVTIEELAALSESYDAFLRRNPEEPFVASVRETAEANSNEAAAEGDSLFFMDSVGGKKKQEQKAKAGSKRKQPAAASNDRATKQSQEEQQKEKEAMAQGKGYLKKSTKNVKNASAKPSKKAKAYGHKFSAAKFTKKGNPTTEVRRNETAFKKHGDKSVTGFINRNIEETMASRVVQAGTAFSLPDIKAAGKERLKEINQAARTKKRSRVEQKLKALEKSIKEQDEGVSRTKRPTAAAVVKRD